MELTTLEKPARSLFWTAPVPDGGELTTDDPLGLDYIAQQVGLFLLPNLTTRSTRAQAFAMVLYGLNLVDRAIADFEYPNTDERRRELFERWERFWALATFEYRQGQLARGDWDAMRGLRGAKAAWRVGEADLPLDFMLISRQQELGNLGAYLAPLRRARLVVDGGLKPTASAMEIVDCFWDEPTNSKRDSYSWFALELLKPGRKATIPRKYGALTLRKVGERSRLTCLHHDRPDQQKRLYTALFERAHDPNTLAVARLVEQATKAGIREPRDILDRALAGAFGSIEVGLRDLMLTARVLGEYVVALMGAFDRIYDAVQRGGWIVPRAKVAQAALGEADLEALRRAAGALLEAPQVDRIRQLPIHGRSALLLAQELLDATPVTALTRVLAYHASVQRERRRGTGWLREEGDKLVLVVRSYTPRPAARRFPSFKLDAVRTLLVDTGRLPFEGAVASEEASA